MKRKIKTLKRLKTVREHLRDAAAAERAVAEGQWQQRNRQLAAARSRHARASQLLSTQLESAACVSDIELIRSELAASREQLLRARQAVVESRLVAETKSAEVQRCERSLRTSERLLARLTSEHSASTAKAEQREHDDISASRHRRSA